MKNKGSVKSKHPGKNNTSNESEQASDDIVSSNNDSETQMKKNVKSSSSKVLTLVLPRWMYCYIPLICVIAAVFVAAIATSILQYQRDNWLLERTSTLGWEAVDTFSNFDTDGDAFLSLDEAMPLLNQVMIQAKDKDSTLNLDIVPGEDTILVEARFSPLNLSTMTKDFQHDPGGNQSFQSLFAWQSPHIPSKEFGVSNFFKLLPDETDMVPGHVYTLVGAPSGLMGAQTLSSDRYYPPRVMGRSFVLHRLLSMFHPRPFLVMRFPPQGVLACVRAISHEHVEIIFRMHPEFQLGEPPSTPFWFTPAQFTGSLIMSRDGSSVEHFHLYVPNERLLNVDMEWLTDPDDRMKMEVDIGYLPLMELVTQGPSSVPTKTKGSTDRKFSKKDLQWESEITASAARDILEQQFFPFKQVNYYNLSDALDLAKSESKLLHSILLWGALDDQSC